LPQIFLGPLSRKEAIRIERNSVPYYGSVVADDQQGRTGAALNVRSKHLSRSVLVTVDEDVASVGFAALEDLKI
jgi:hypothetical protein